MKKVTIEPGCISCGSCAFIVPEVFQVTDVSHVKEKADLKKHKEKIIQAACACPVSVIKYKE